MFTWTVTLAELQLLGIKYNISVFTTCQSLMRSSAFMEAAQKVQEIESVGL